MLLHLVRDIYPDMPAVFVNTGLEYPEIQAFARSQENVTVLTPKMGFKDVITKYGYPFISKEISKAISEAKRGSQHSLDKFDPFSAYAKRYPKWTLEKWEPLLSVDFDIDNRCCDVMKKGPAKAYEKETGRHPITGQMAVESNLRQKQWLEHGCNVFGKRAKSNPMSFWTEQDVLKFIKANGIKIASVYGDIVSEDEDGNAYETTLFESCPYKTTGCQRTGCIFCGFGAHLEKGESRFQRLKRTHPKQYNFCMNGGSYDSEDGKWKPNKKGLGMAHCIEEMCKIYGKDFIKYE